ncbi:hypothetical protein EC988_006250 [Linderina pennispora]|nr:hypothetical protein EC988_006250 [Linderina pennispora]
MDGLLSVSAQVSEILSSPKVSALYIRQFIEQAQAARTDDKQPETVRVVMQALRDLKISDKARIFHVPSTFYSWALPTRALSMAAPSPQHLCKSVVFENKRFKGVGSKYYCVIVQYVQTINTGALTDFVRELDGNAVARKHYNFRLANPDDALELTGFGNNGVCPIGMKRPVPIVLSKSITTLSPAVFWCGAGDIDYKLAMPTQTFIEATRCHVADISVPVQE